MKNGYVQEVPSVGGEDFKGWYVSDETNLVNVSTYVISEDVTFYSKIAKWTNILPEMVKMDDSMQILVDGLTTESIFRVTVGKLKFDITIGVNGYYLTDTRESNVFIADMGNTMVELYPDYFEYATFVVRQEETSFEVKTVASNGPENMVYEDAEDLILSASCQEDGILTFVIHQSEYEANDFDSCQILSVEIYA